MTEDRQLLHEYVRDGSPDALNELVRRYRDLVYSSALRQVRDAHLAEDVAQAVFIVLSKKASTIRQGVAMGGWLLAVTRRAALNAMKKQAIQHRHERAAAKTEVFETAEASWEQIDPVLDSMMSRLSSKDRDAIVLRYFQDRSFAQVGAELGLSEDAARKRVGRAIERMRGLLSRHGVHLGAAALGTAIAANSVQAGPLTIMGVATSSSATNIAKGVITMMTWTKIKAVAAAAVLFVSLAGGAVLVMTAMAQQPQQAAQSIPPAVPATAPFDADAARAAILVRFQTLQNFSVSYHTETANPQAAGRAMPGAAPATLPATAIRNGTGGRGGRDNSPRDIVLSRLGDKFRMETRLNRIQGSRATGPSDVHTTTVAADVDQSLMVVTGGGMDEISGGIGLRTPGFNTDLLALGLGLAQGPGGRSWLNAIDVELMEIDRTPDGHVLLNFQSNSASGRTPAMMQWEFLPDLGYAVFAYRYLIGPEKQLNVEVLADDFKSVNGLMLPFTMRERIGTARNGQWTETQRVTATVTQYTLHDPGNNDARYEIAWPAGAIVFDGRNESRYIANAQGKLISEEETDREKYKATVAAVVAKTDWSALSTFAPAVTGLVVGEYRRGFKANMVDLDVGRVLDRPQAPAPLPPKSPEDVARFQEESRAIRQLSLDTGADLTFTYTASGKYNGWGMFMLGSFLTQMPAEAWDKPDAAALRASFATGDIGGMHLVTAPDIGVLLGPDPKLPLVFAYYTRDGGVGMVRITKLESTVTAQVTVDVIKVVQSRK